MFFLTVLIQSSETKKCHKKVENVRIWSFFAVFGLNAKICCVTFHIQSEYGKNPVFTSNIDK